MDHVHPFGSAAASSNAGMIDDLKIFRQPLTASMTTNSNTDIPEYEYNREEALQCIAPLSVPWHKEKGDSEFHYRTTFIGYYWDLVLRRVSLNVEKRLKFHNRVRVFIDRFDGHRCTLKDVEKIHGSLCHDCFCLRRGSLTITLPIQLCIFLQRK